MLFAVFLKLNLPGMRLFLNSQKEFSNKSFVQIKSKIYFNLLPQYLFKIDNQIFCSLKIQIYTWLLDKNLTFITQMWQTRPIWSMMTSAIPIHLVNFCEREISWLLPGPLAHKIFLGRDWARPDLIL